MLLDAKIGPMKVAVRAGSDVSLRFSERLRYFACDSHGKTDWTLVVSKRPLPERGHKVVGRSPEVGLRFSNSPDWRVYARMRRTPRSVGRSIKRVTDRAHYRDGRWSLLLRNAFELPALSVLEYVYGYVPIHAATLAGSDGAVMLMGPNGAGKSTLACRLSDALGLDLLSDNFTPCDGSTALAFPGPPRAKPGDSLPLLMPKNRSAELRGLVVVGFGLPANTSHRRKALARYLGEDYDAHRGTGWASAIAGSGAETQSAQNNQSVAAKLSGLPHISYDWASDSVDGVVEFVKRDVGV